MAAVAPQPEQATGWPADTPAPAMEMLSAETERALLERYDTMNKHIEEQGDTLQKLMESQRLIEEKQAKALADDKKALAEKFAILEKKLTEQATLVASVQQQQNHIIKLISIQDKLAEQDRQLRMFFDYQQNFLSTLQSPMTAQAEVFHALHDNQARMMQALSSINMPIPTELPNFSMSYAIPAALGELPQPANRKKEQPAPPDPSTKYTNVPTPLGGLKPFEHFDADEDAKRLRKAMKGIGTDEKVLITVLGNRANEQRQQIAQAYKTNYKRDLPIDLKEENSGNFATILTALMQPPAVYDAHCVYNAIKGLGTNDNALIEVLCTRTNKQIKDLKDAYKTEFSRELDGDVRGDTSGDYQNLLMAILRCQRDETNKVDMLRAKEDATSLYNAGEARVGTNEQIFITIFTQRNYAHLRAVCDCYAKLEDFDLEKSVARETSFNFRKALITILKFARNAPLCFAEMLHQAMYGLGTNNSVLTRVVVSRSEIDLRDIELAYKQEYKQSLTQKIRSETSGDYRKMLIELFGDQGFNPEVDAKNLRQAMKGWGTVEVTINKIIANRTNAQRLAIRDAYLDLYKRDLAKDLESETSGDYKDLLLALMQPPDEFLAREAWRTMKGLGTDDNSLIEIICSRNGFQMRTLKEAYSKIHGRDLASDVRSDTSGDYQQLLLALIAQERDDKEPVDAQAALAEAQRLYKAGEEMTGTDEAVFIEVLSRHSLPQLAVIFEQYNKLCDYDIEKSLSRETSFNFKKALLAIVQVVRDPAQYYARRLFATMAGAGTQDLNLIRIMVERSEIDLRSINDAFFKVHKKTLETMIRGDTSGHYRKLLLRILDRARSLNPAPSAVTPAAAAVAAAATKPVEIKPATQKTTAVPVLVGDVDEKAREKAKEKEKEKEKEKAAAAKPKAAPAPARAPGLTITTGDSSVTFTPGNAHEEATVEYDYDGDGVTDVTFKTPAQPSGQKRSDGQHKYEAPKKAEPKKSDPPAKRKSTISLTIGDTSGDTQF